MISESPRREDVRPIFRYYDRAALDRQYNAVATVADVQPILREYARLTRQAQARLRCDLAVRYGESEAERLDIYRAVGDRPAPVFFFIHGGYWRMLDAADSGFMAETLCRAGACVVAVNYALAPGATLDEIVRQCRAALAWTYRHIAAYGGDPRRIHVAGSSAGGHLAAMLAARGWTEAASLPDNVVASLTAMSGLYDLRALPQAYVNEWLQLDESAAARNSPIAALPRAGMPAIVTYAPSETDEFKRQSEIYIAACNAIGCPARFVAVAGTNHFDIVLALNRIESDLAAVVFAQLGITAEASRTCSVDQGG